MCENTDENKSEYVYFSRSASPANLVYNGTESLSHLVPKRWELVPNGTIALDSLSEFKNAIELWKPVRCVWRICRIAKPTCHKLTSCSRCNFYNFVFIIYSVEYGNFTWFLGGKILRRWAVFRDFFLFIYPFISRWQSKLYNTSIS